MVNTSRLRLDRRYLLLCLPFLPCLPPSWSHSRAETDGRSRKPGNQEARKPGSQMESSTIFLAARASGSNGRIRGPYSFPLASPLETPLYYEVASLCTM